MTSPRASRQAALLTLAAAALLVGLHWVPASTALSHLDFLPAGADALPLCDPANPRFLAVVERAAPVTLTLAPDAPLVAGQPGRVRLTLRTASGKPIGPDDLLPTATRKILLLAADPKLEDFQTPAPVPAGGPGEWSFALTPRRPGIYRVFADLTPRATRQELYASADLPVAAAAVPASASAPAGPEEPAYRFDLVPASRPVYARQPVTFRLSVTAAAGGLVPLSPDLGTFGHLTAFDQDRTGLVHLPGPASPGAAPDPFRPQLTFSVTFPEPGHYVIWSEVNLNGQVRRRPFSLDVLP